MSEPTEREPLSEAEIEDVATLLSELYEYTYYLGDLPNDGHRNDARALLALRFGPGLVGGIKILRTALRAAEKEAKNRKRDLITYQEAHERDLQRTRDAIEERDTAESALRAAEDDRDWHIRAHNEVCEMGRQMRERLDAAESSLTRYKTVAEAAKEWVRVRHGNDPTPWGYSEANLRDAVAALEESPDAKEPQA